MRASLLLLLALISSPAFAQQASPRALDPEDLSIQNFLQALETSISTTNRQGWIDLVSASADRDKAIVIFSRLASS